MAAGVVGAGGGEECGGDGQGEEAEKIVDDIEAELRRSGRVEIPSGEIGEMVMDRLRDLDEVAYIRFASVYREFMDLQQVKREIEQVLSSRRP